jgi:hypothetical protein
MMERQTKMMNPVTADRMMPVRISDGDAIGIAVEEEVELACDVEEGRDEVVRGARAGGTVKVVPTMVVELVCVDEEELWLLFVDVELLVAEDRELEDVEDDVALWPDAEDVVEAAEILREIHFVIQGSR